MITDKMNKIKMLVMDVDGTLTDGSIYISEDGEIMKQFNVKDGLGIGLLHRSNIVPAIITGRNSKILLERARELEIDFVMQGKDNKAEAMKQLAKENHVSLDEMAFIGDDLNDLPALKVAGLSVCPGDALERVKKECDIVLKCTGGHGAVREIAEILLKAQDKYERIVNELYETNEMVKRGIQ